MELRTTQPARRYGPRWMAVAAAFAWLLSSGVSAGDDDYTAMLGHLASSRLDGHAVQGAEGSIAPNLAAGDLHAQANRRAFAGSPAAQAQIDARQQQRAGQDDAPSDVQDSTDGQALSGVQLNRVADLREVTGDILSLSVSELPR
jgi:hypothetical protein